MRVLEVLTHAEWGGREDVVVSLSRALAVQGHEVTVACPADTPMWRRAEAVGLSLTPFRLRGKGFSLRDLQAMRRLLAGARVDLVHLHDRASYAALLHTLPGLRRQAMIYTAHGVRRLNRRRRLMLRWLPHPIVAVSGAVRSSLVQNGVRPDRVVVIPNGLDVRAFQAAAGQGPDLRPELGLRDGAPVVGGVGRLSPEKGFDDFVRAAAAIASRRPEAQFVIVGDGPERAALQRLGTDLGLGARLVFAGYRTDVARALRSMDLLLFPSVCDEACPMVPIQAGALGLPIVATRSGGAPEIVLDGVTGLTVDKGAPEAMAEAAVTLLQAEGRRRQMGAAAAGRVREHYEIGVTAGRYAELGEVLMAGQRRGHAAAGATPCR